MDFFTWCALPFSGVRIAEPIVLAQHKGHERIGLAQKAIWHTSPIDLEITY
jgi:hypothetical protein